MKPNRVAGPARAGVHLPTAIATGLLYFVASQFGHLLDVPPSGVTPLWPPSGFALLSLVLLGRRYWLAVLLGAFAAQAYTFFIPQNPVTSLLICGAIAVGSTGQAYVGAWALQRWIGDRSPFGQISDVMRFAAVAYLGSTISPTVGVLSLFLGGAVTPDGVLATWDTWWLGDALGIIVIFPLPYMWRELKLRHISGEQLSRWLVFLGVFALIAAVVFTPITPIAERGYPLGVLLIPFLVWGSHHGGMAATAALSFLLAAIAVSGTVSGSGPFARATIHESVLVVQLYTGIMVCMGYALAASKTQFETTEAAALMSAARTRTIISSVPDLLVVLDRDARPIEHLSGPKPSVPTSMHSVVHGLTTGSTAEVLRGVVREVIAKLEIQEIEYEIETDEGPRWWSARVVPVEQVEQQHVLWAARDITAQKTLEAEVRQEQKMAVIGQLAGGIAHDFNNLLTVINGTADLLVEEAEGDDSDDLCRIQAAGRQAAALTSQLMAFSRKAVIRPTAVDLGQTIGRLQQMLSRTLGTAVRLDVQLARGLPAILGDEGQIEQVLLNLIINARDAVDRDGSIQVRAHHEADGAALGVVVLEVSDDGHGMSPAVQKRIFEPFFTTRTVGEGTGLGLSTVYGIVKRWEGEIEVESAVGFGTTFRVRWPAIAHTADATADASGLHQGDGETILVLDDQPEVLCLIVRLVERMGYRAIGLETGAEILKYAADPALPVHALLTDVMLPVLSGPAVAHHFRSLRPGLPVIFMSGFSGAHPREEHLESEPFFIKKPMSFSTLATVIGQAMASESATSLQAS